MENLYDVDASTEKLGGISQWTLRKHIEQGTIRVTRLGKRIFLSSQEIARIQREGLPSLKCRSGRASGDAHGSRADESKS